MATYEVNDDAVTFARDLIRKRRYVRRSQWNDAQPSTDEQNAYLERHGWADYGTWHLATTVGAAAETKGRYAFAFGDFRRLHRSGLIACVFRAAEWHHKKVELAAHDLLQEFDAAVH